MLVVHGRFEGFTILVWRYVQRVALIWRGGQELQSGYLIDQDIGWIGITDILVGQAVGRMKITVFYRIFLLVLGWLCQ